MSGEQIGELDSVRLEDEYRAYAAETISLASKQRDSTDKGRLLGMAEAWIDLADRAAKSVRRRRVTVEHPLVEHMLGPDQPRAE